jgi:hypothetical protein
MDEEIEELLKASELIVTILNRIQRRKDGESRSQNWNYFMVEQTNDCSRDYYIASNFIRKISIIGINIHSKTSC